jgi:hypothetical protein
MPPMIDAAALPKGAPGFDNVRLRYTQEVPAASVDGTGAFRTACDFSHMSYDDPIVYPGQPGKAHLHAFFGNKLANAYSTANSLATSGNSTCRGGIINRSAYWVPAVIDKDGKPVAPRDMGIYYKSGYGGLAPGQIKPFPQGLRMIAGNPKATGPQERVDYECASQGKHSRSIATMCNPGEMMLMSIEFPQCWDGKNLDSADHQSHMSYPVSGGCPSTHPVAIPAITFKVVYIVPSTGTAGWRLSSDMYDSSLPGGYSLHGDWFSGWDPAIVEEFVRDCDNKPADCHSHLLGPNREIY